MTKLVFAAVFARLAAANGNEEAVVAGRVRTRMVRLPGGGAGRWDRHDSIAETVLVWSGDFHVEFRDGSVAPAARQGCVVPAGHDHRGTSQGSAEVILFTQVGSIADTSNTRTQL